MRVLGKEVVGSQDSIHCWMDPVLVALPAQQTRYFQQSYSYEIRSQKISAKDLVRDTISSTARRPLSQQDLPYTGR